MQFQREDDGEFINGLGPQGDIFLTTRPITITVKLAAGLVENFFLETKKGIVLCWIALSAQSPFAMIPSELQSLNTVECLKSRFSSERTCSSIHAVN